MISCTSRFGSERTRSTFGDIGDPFGSEAASLQAGSHGSPLRAGADRESNPLPAQILCVQAPSQVDRTFRLADHDFDEAVATAGDVLDRCLPGSADLDAPLRQFRG